jgi:4-hydroxyphenylpyruvate dioxygenase
MTEQNPLGLKKIHHVEFYVGNAKQAEFYYRKAFGFSRVAYSGLETGNRETTSYVLRQNRVNFVLTTPLTPEHAAAEHIKLHGDGVRDIAFQVEDADHAFNEAIRRGARGFIEPHDWKDENGMVRRAAIHTYGDTIHSFISYNSANNGHNYNGVFLPGFTEQTVAGEEVGIVLVDHIVGNVELGKMNFWCDFYRDVMGFERYITFDDKDISTEYSALMSIVMSDGGHNIKFPINEPAEGKGGKSQIQEYIDFYRSAGAQHVALLCKDVRETVAKLQANGVEFLRVPDTYYEELPSRIGEIDEDIEDLKRLGILVDRDDEGYLLQSPSKTDRRFFMKFSKEKAAKALAKATSKRSLFRLKKSKDGAEIFNQFKMQN